MKKITLFLFAMFISSICFAQKEGPAQKEMPAQKEVPAQKEILPQKEAPAQEEKTIPAQEPVAKETPAAQEAPVAQIVGVGSTSQCAAHLFIRGPTSAFFETRVCRISGHFSSGSQCYAIWELNGQYTTRWVSARDSDAMEDFLKRTKEARTVLYAADPNDCTDGY